MHVLGCDFFNTMKCKEVIFLIGCQQILINGDKDTLAIIEYLCSAKTLRGGNYLETVVVDFSNLLKAS